MTTSILSNSCGKYLQENMNNTNIWPSISVTKDLFFSQLFNKKIYVQNGSKDSNRKRR